MGQWVHNVTPEVNDISQWPTILAVCTTLTIAMMTTVALRAYVRGAMLKTIGYDDWIIFFSAVCGVIYSGLGIGQSRYGLGLDLRDRPQDLDSINTYSILNFVGRPFYMAGITGFKIALCLSYLRILSQGSRLYRRIVWVTLISCTLLHVGGTLLLLFQCKPVQKSWRPKTPGSCLRNDVTFYVLAAITILFDCIIFFLPIPILLQLQINARRKAVLLIIFLLGMFTTVCSIMRMVQIITIAKNGNSTMLVLWGTIELNVGILLTCIPTLTPLFTYFREKSTRGYYNNNSHHTPGNSMPLKSRQESRLDHSTSSGKWGSLERDSDDNSSQRKIITEMSSTYAGESMCNGKSSTKVYTNESPGFSPFEVEQARKVREAEEGIRATVTVEVVHEEAKDSHRTHHERWKTVRGHSRDASINRARKEREVLGML